MKRILIVTSGADSIELKGNRDQPTGYYLNELAVPALRFIEAGYELDIATPNGTRPTMDERSKSVGHFGNDAGKMRAALNFVERRPGMAKPMALHEAAMRSSDYVAIFIPGGHAPIADLMDDPDLGKILREFHAQGKPTAALCHGPVALLSALPRASAYRKSLVAGDRTASCEAGSLWPYEDYRMTIFSTEEEKIVERDIIGKQLQFYVADALAGAGGKVENAPTFHPFVVQDRELITAQNPASDERLAQAVLKALTAKKLMRAS
jgi:putative intracellular protease/amidase